MTAGFPQNIKEKRFHKAAHENAQKLLTPAPLQNCIEGSSHAALAARVGNNKTGNSLSSY